MNAIRFLRNVLSFLFIFSFSLSVFAQNFPVTGKITNANGEALAGVTVRVKGSSTQTVTNADGSFQLNASPISTLVFSYVGFAEQEQAVNNRAQINIAMAPLAQSMENVVVVGYGTQKKRNVTGAIATFNTDNLDERPIVRVDQALVGQMAGVQVKQTSGALGKGFSVQVRGTGSISAGNEPLYVIDGFPLATARPNGAGNFSSGNPLDNINPNDIESIQVLKDAAAAAIYGSRAANGVVLITTKKGKSGKPQINLNSYAGYAERSKKLDMLSGEEWIVRATEMINAAYVAKYGTLGATANDNSDVRRQFIGLAPGAVNTAFMLDERWAQAGHPGLRLIDWQDETFRKGVVQNHQVSASGGTESVHYYISGNFLDQEGMVKGTDYRAYSGRANVEVTASQKLKFGINIAPTYSVNNDPGVEGKDNILHQLLSFTPVQEDSMGLYPNVGKNGQYRWSTSANSPVGKLDYYIGQTKRFRTVSTIFGDYQIIKGLNLRTTVNLDNTDNNTKSYVPYIVASNQASRQAQLNTLSSGSSAGFRKQTFVNENTLSFTRTILEQHDVALLAGASYNSDKIDNIRVASSGGFRNGITTINNANAVTGTSSESRNVLISYFGRLQYGFDNKYLLSASIRRDGSSRFGEDTRWGIFPSASVGWRISEEQFMSGISQISDLKLRASWGKSGNNNIPDYGSIPLLGASNYTLNNVVANGQAPAGIANPKLAWEKSETFDVGFDLGILNNRITAAFDYYKRKSSDLLLNVPVSAITGSTTVLSNAGKTENKGWEIELTSRNTTGTLQWTTTANISRNSNKLLELANGQTQTIIPSAYGAASEHSILKVGQPMYSIYVIGQKGILTQEDISKNVALFGSETIGDPKYIDANGDGKIDLNDRVIMGKPNPDYIWGLTNTFRYKGFDFSFLVQGQWGGQIYSLLGRALGRTGQGFTDNPLGFYTNRWYSPEHPGAGRVSKAYSTFGFTANTDWLYSSDYIRVRNITLGYNLGKLFNTKTIQGARVYATAENFFGWDKYKGGLNPEATNTDLSGNGDFPEPGDYGGLPLPRSLILGINFTF